MQERAREINRLQKMLEGANIKLSSGLVHSTATKASNCTSHAYFRLTQDYAFILTKEALFFDAYL